MPQHHRHAFTLIELSIVLVIVGLVISGILSGKALIKSAELRSVMTEANNYLTAINSFRSQYRYLPGDMPTATRYWTTADGNGDGQVLTTERFRLWQQLSLAGMIEKTYTGATGGGGADDFIMGSETVGNNVPESRIKFSGFSFYYANMTTNGATTYTMNMGNMLTFGTSMGTDAGAPTNAALKPVDAAKIDGKMDDGIPGAGNWIANGIGGGNFGTATSCTTSANGTDYTGTYRGTNETTSCSFFIKSGF